jgi:hypothetical protein
VLMSIPAQKLTTLKSLHPFPGDISYRYHKACTGFDSTRLQKANG